MATGMEKKGACSIYNCYSLITFIPYSAIASALLSAGAHAGCYSLAVIVYSLQLLVGRSGSRGRTRNIETFCSSYTHPNLRLLTQPNQPLVKMTSYNGTEIQSTTSALNAVGTSMEAGQDVPAEFPEITPTPEGTGNGHEPQPEAILKKKRRKKRVRKRRSLAMRVSTRLTDPAEGQEK